MQASDRAGARVERARADRRPSGWDETPDPALGPSEVPGAGGRAWIKARRIVVIMTKLNQAGAQLVGLQLARRLRARGHTVETWFLYRQAAAYEGEPATRVLLDQRGPGPFGYIRILVSLIRTLRAARPDAVYTLLPLANVLGGLVAWFVGVPVRVASQHYPRDTQSPVMRWLDQAMGSLGIYTTNVAVSHSVAASYASAGRRYCSRLEVIPNGHSLRACALSQTEARIRFGLPEAAFLLGAIGRLAPQKDPEFALRLIARLPAEHLVWAGDGPLADNLRRTIAREGLSDRVHLLGQIAEETVPVFFRALDLAIMPSRYEGLPLVLLEAMDAGVPVVASDIPSIAEVALSPDGTVAATLSAQDDLEGWLTAIERLRREPAESLRLVEAGRARVRDFSLPRMADRYERLLRPTASARLVRSQDW